MAVAISAARGGGYAVSALVAKPLCGHTPRQVCVSLRLTRAAFAQARKTVQGGRNCCTLGAMATKGTVIRSDPERAKMRDALKEGCVPEPGSMRVFTREENSSAVAQGCNLGQEGISAVGRRNTLLIDSLQGRETVRVQCISQRLRPKIRRVRQWNVPGPTACDF